MNTDLPLTPGVEASLRIIERALPYLQSATREPEAPFDFAAVVRALHARRPIPDREYQALRVWSIAAGEADLLVGSANYIGWGAFGRSMTTSTGGKGGYLVGHSVGPMAEALRGASLLVTLGARAESGFSDTVTLPTEASTGTASWVAQGTAPSGDAEPTLGAVSVTPKTCIARLDTSIQFARIAVGSQALGRSLMANNGEAIDRAAILGAGGAEPLGILNTPQVTKISGASITWATVAGMRETALNAGAEEGSLVWLAAPGVQKLLASREKAGGSGFIWANGEIDGVRAVATRRMPAGTLLLAPVGSILIAGFGPGPQVEVSPSAGFNDARLAMRVMTHVDVALTNAAAFVAATGVS